MYILVEYLPFIVVVVFFALLVTVIAIELTKWFRNYTGAFGYAIIVDFTVLALVIAFIYTHIR